MILGTEILSYLESYQNKNSLDSLACVTMLDFDSNFGNNI